MTITNELKDAQARFWYGYINNPILYDLPVSADWKGAQELCNLAFRAGARWNMRVTGELSPHIAQFIRMLILLGYLDDDDLTRPSDRDRRARGDLLHPAASEVVSTRSGEALGDVHISDNGTLTDADDPWLDRVAF